MANCSIRKLLGHGRKMEEKPCDLNPRHPDHKWSGVKMLNEKLESVTFVDNLPFGPLPEFDDKRGGARRQPKGYWKDRFRFLDLNPERYPDNNSVINTPNSRHPEQVQMEYCVPGTTIKRYFIEEERILAMALSNWEKFVINQLDKKKWNYEMRHGQVFDKKGNFHSGSTSDEWM